MKKSKLKKHQILQKLKEDEHYYGTFGKQYLSNSDINILLNNPLNLHKPYKQNPNFLVGGYFHTAILEPEKLKSFKIVESTSRNTKDYMLAGGDVKAIKSKYKLTASQEKQLNELKEEKEHITKA